MSNDTKIIDLVDLVGDSAAFGNDEGRAVFQKLSEVLDSFPNKKTFGISLMGITRTDASFPRESVISLAKARRGEKGFFLLGFASQDLMDNWSYAARAKEQPMIVLVEEGYQVIGTDLSAGAREILDFVMNEGTVTTSMVAAKYNLSAQNASAKLKKLYQQGLIVGSKEVAESGGMEFIYKALKVI